jgi:hypothetical protein
MVGRNINQFSYYGNKCGGSRKKLKIELPYDVAIPFLNIYPKESKSSYNRDTCIVIFLQHYSR